MEAVVQSADLALLELAVENTELRRQLAEAQEQCVELAVDSGELQAEIEALRTEIALLKSGAGAG